MTAATFTDLIKNTAQLYKISYAELKSLVLQYPYCQNLRYLLLKKCMFEDHADFDENLQLAATFSHDRTKLYEQINVYNSLETEPSELLLIEKEHADPEENEDTESDKIELKKETTEDTIPLPDSQSFESKELKEEDIELEKTKLPEIEAEEMTEPKSQIVSEEISYFDEIDSDAEIEDITDEMELEYDFSEFGKPEPELNEESENVISIEDLIELDNAIPLKKVADDAETTDRFLNKEQKKVEKKKDVQIEENPEKGSQSPPPTPKSSFGSWVKQFQETDELEEDIKKKKRKKVKKKHKKDVSVSKKKKKKKHLKKGNKSVAFAEQSLKENKEIVSETLANILASQGSYEKAIEMFEKLSLIFPKKSGYFADQIKKLKK